LSGAEPLGDDEDMDYQGAAADTDPHDLDGLFKFIGT
jgi:hypothetical protein